MQPLHTSSLVAEGSCHIQPSSNPDPDGDAGDADDDRNVSSRRLEYGVEDRPPAYLATIFGLQVSNNFVCLKPNYYST